MAKSQPKDPSDRESLSQIAETKVPAQKIDEGDLLNSFGASGTQLINGFLESDYNALLAGTQGLDTFDRMRKSDAQVFATLLVVELPIRSARWYVDPATNDQGEVDDQAREIADFVEEALFERMEQTWDDFLREVLTMLTFGFEVKEKVYKAEEDKIWLKKLASRRQRTIYKWQQEDSSPGVTQLLPQVKVEGTNAGKNNISIPAEKLLVFTFRREGDNYQGVSVLRSCYKHWYIKDTLYKFDAVKHERQSIGIPMMWLPKGATDKDKSEAKKIVKNIKANEMTGIVFPGPKVDGWDFAFADMHVASQSNLWESIDHHNREISKNVLAQFLELGATKNGSRAVSADHSELFLLGLQAVAQQIADTMNRYVIRELVDMNFDGVTDYPELKFDRIQKIDFEKLGMFLTAVASGGFVRPDEGIEEKLRDMLDFPAIQDDMPTRQEQQDQAMQHEQALAKAAGKPAIPGKPGDKKAAVKASEDPSDAYRFYSGLVNNRLITRLQNEAATPEDLAVLKKKGFRFSEAEGSTWRTLTFAERKINISSLRKAMSEFTAKLDSRLDDITAKQKQDILNQVKRAVEANDIAAVGQIRARYTGDLAQALTDVQKEMFEVGKKSAANEMNVLAPGTRAEVRGAMRVQNDMLVEKYASDIEHAAKNAVSQLAAKNGGSITNTQTDEALAAVADAIDGAASARASMKTLTLSGSLNMGRATIFERYPEKVYAFQFSAIIDDRTTDLCLSLDGRVVAPGSSEFTDYSPPLHENCRSIWVEILNEEEFKPEIDGIPSSIPTSTTIESYAGMKAPVVKPGSPAVRQIKQELDQRRQKLEEYRSSGTYPNRQDAHAQRIQDLEDAIDGEFHELCQTMLSESGVHFSEN